MSTAESFIGHSFMLLNEEIKSNNSIDSPVSVSAVPHPKNKTERKRTKTEKIEFKRLSIALPEKVAEILEELSKLQGITQVEALKRAILTEALLQKEIHQGADILIRKPDGTIERIIFR
jgi:hypothetical protein